MRTFAYCCASFAEATRRAAGVEPLLSPPLSIATFKPEWLNGEPFTGRPWDLLYFDLHGQPSETFWRGDGGTIALTADQIRETYLGGAVVFGTNCYLGDLDSPMLKALFDAGAKYVIGGEGQNWASVKRASGATLLGQRFRQILASGASPLKALALAKLWVRWDLRKHTRKGSAREILADKDTLAFRAYYREA